MMAPTDTGGEDPPVPPTGNELPRPTHHRETRLNLKKALKARQGAAALQQTVQDALPAVTEDDNNGDVDRRPGTELEAAAEERADPYDEYDEIDNDLQEDLQSEDKIRSLPPQSFTGNDFDWAQQNSRAGTGIESQCGRA
jgi:hypothetical protein